MVIIVQKIGKNTEIRNTDEKNRLQNNRKKRERERERSERENDFIQKFCSASPAGQAKIIFGALERLSEEKADKRHRHKRTIY